MQTSVKEVVLGYYGPVELDWDTLHICTIAGVAVELCGVEIWGKLLGAEVESPALDVCLS